MKKLHESFDDFVKENTKERGDLNRIRSFKGSIEDLKNFFDEMAGKNTNAFNTPVRQGFNNVHPTRIKTTSPHWNED